MSELRRPDDAATDDELLRLIESAIDQLPDEFRLVFVLRAVDQLGVAETAACLGINRATVKTRFHRARARLRETLGEHLDLSAADCFSFGGQRCDRIVVTVIQRIDQRQATTGQPRAKRPAGLDRKLTLINGKRTAT